MLTTREQKRESALNKPLLTNDALDEVKFPQYEPLITKDQSLQELSQTKYKNELTVDDVVIPSKLSNPDPNQQAINVLNAFNQYVVKNIIVEANSARPGLRIEVDEFMLGHRNKVPELALGTGKRLTKALTSPYSEDGIIGVYKQNAEFFGAHGSYVVNVPIGKYAKAWSANKPLLLGSGIHVIHDTLFRFNKEFVSQLENYITHGNNLHILRVPQGKFAKVFINGQPKLLEAREEPYVFNTPLFQFDKDHDYVSQLDNYIEHKNLHIIRVPQGKIAKVIVNGKPELLTHRDEPYVYNTPLFQFNPAQDFVDQLDNYIEHKNLHILRVPQGKYAKVYLEGQPKLLEPNNKPYEYNTPLFQFDKNTGFVDQSERYIKHGNKHIVRVPGGSVAKVWIGNEPRLLEAQKEPYVFDEPYFKLDEVNYNGQSYLFANATDKLIEHGALKRIIPPIGEVAITNNNGKLEIVDQRKLIDSASHSVVGFLSTGIQTLVFPSEETKKQRLKENKNASADEVSYEVFTTKDSLKVGVKLLVAYKITDQEKAVRLLGKDGIMTHIENLATVDMGKAIQQCSSQEFLCFYQTKPRIDEAKHDDSSAPSAPLNEHFQDTVKRELATDLREYGIELVRLNFETPKILDSEIAKKMSEQSLTTARVNAEQAVLSQEFTIAKTRKEQQALVSQIEQSQNNANKLSEARTQLEVAEKQAKAEIIKAKAHADALLLEAKARNKAALLEADTQRKIAEQRGKQFLQFPGLLEVELAKLRYGALGSSKPSFVVTSQEFASLFSSGSNLTLFPMQNVNRQPLFPIPVNTSNDSQPNILDTEQKKLAK